MGGGGGWWLDKSGPESPEPARPIPDLELPTDTEVVDAVVPSVVSSTQALQWRKSVLLSILII